MWQPLSEGELWDKIQEAEGLLEPPARRFWNLINIRPQKWQHSPQGDDGGGFWVVALLGQKCVYYNDIERQYQHFLREVLYEPS